MNRHQIRDQIVLITGASAGIGRQTALRFADLGARVVLVSRNSSGGLERVAHEIQASGGQAAVFVADVTKAEEVQRVVNAAEAQFGRIDIAVCNAGEYLRCPVHQLTLADIERMMAVNFYGTVHVVQAVLPRMLERRHGHIVAVTSVDGRKGLPPDGAYVASKFATTGYMEVLRQELRGRGVFASTILPGRVDTGMIAQWDFPFVSPKISSERVARAIVRAIVQGRREIVVPFWGSKALLVLSAFTPLFGDLIVRLFKLEGRPTQTERIP